MARNSKHTGPGEHLKSCFYIYSNQIQDHAGDQLRIKDRSVFLSGFDLDYTAIYDFIDSVLNTGTHTWRFTRSFLQNCSVIVWLKSNQQERMARTAAFCLEKGVLVEGDSGFASCSTFVTAREMVRRSFSQRMT